MTEAGVLIASSLRRFNIDVLYLGRVDDDVAIDCPTTDECLGLEGGYILLCKAAVSGVGGTFFACYLVPKFTRSHVQDSRSTSVSVITRQPRRCALTGRCWAMIGPLV
jgi:hypothetical protein